MKTLHKSKSNSCGTEEVAMKASLRSRINRLQQLLNDVNRNVRMRVVFRYEETKDGLVHMSWSLE